jgi:uncharacterized membrane protein YfcA
MSLMLYLFAGAIAGLLSGLFGVGGGAIIVPLLIFIFSKEIFLSSNIVHLAIGTSFATIIFTSLSSIQAHNRLGNIDWMIVKKLAPGLIIGVFIGSIFANHLKGSTLQAMIALFLFFISFKIWREKPPKVLFNVISKKLLGLIGLLVGGMSAFFGIGGGSLVVPFLLSCKEKMSSAVACSAACGLPIAFVGALTYFWQGYSSENLPTFSTGYIYWPATIAIVLMSIPFAKLGVFLSERINDKKLKRGFSLILAFIALQLVLNR